MTVDRRVSPATVAREWTRTGVTGFGGPPAHIALLRALAVDDRKWLAYRAGGPAIKVVGALSFGGGFVIVSLMQGDAVHVNHWMSNAALLAARRGVVATLLGAAAVGAIAALAGTRV